MSYQVLGITAIAILFFLIRFLSQTDVPKVKGIPEIPGWPLFGSLVELGEFHAKVAQKWSKKYGPVFQARLGNRRIIFANTFDSIRDLWIGQQSSLISRPKLHTFHKIVSTSETFTIGTSPWDESCKNRRKAAATALNRPAVQTYMPIIDLESYVSIKEMMEDSKDGKVEIDPAPYFQRFALNTSLTLNYGFRITGNIEDELLKEICYVERQISNFRSTSNNWQDYVPLLRLLPGGKNKEAVHYSVRRETYMKKLLNMLQERIENGTDKPCITGNILKDPEAKLNDNEIMSIGLTMVSAGLDTVPGNLIMGLAYLACPDGQRIQEKAFSEIKAQYPDLNDAWHMCLKEEKVSYVSALVKETLRFWTVIPISLPRVSIKDITYQGAVIPAGSTFYMNAYGGNYDESHFKDAYSFVPERFLGVGDGGTPHYGYGAGSRMCAGSHLANRELYVAFVRLICAFKMTEAKDPKDRPIMDALLASAQPTSLTMDPRPFKVSFTPRDKGTLEQWLNESDMATKDL